jgi:Asp-tRNA(Asn)/Glu-tRNA(Gln) amidotransferase A subunit family amidase
MTGLWRMGALELGGAIRAREASCEQVIGAHLQRIEAVNVSVNAVAVVLSEQALDLAGSRHYPDDKRRAESVTAEHPRNRPTRAGQLELASLSHVRPGDLRERDKLMALTSMPPGPTR